jgi:hypothetical protein
MAHRFRPPTFLLMTALALPACMPKTHYQGQLPGKVYLAIDTSSRVPYAIQRDEETLAAGDELHSLFSSHPEAQRQAEEAERKLRAGSTLELVGGIVVGAGSYAAGAGLLPGSIILTIGAVKTEKGTAGLVDAINMHNDAWQRDAESRLPPAIEPVEVTP